MQWLIIALIGIVTARIETILGTAFSFGDTMPDIMLLYVIYFAMFCPNDDIPFYAWIMGLTHDFMYEERLGVFAIAYLIAALTIRYTRAILFRQNVLTQILVAFFITFGVYLFISIFQATYGGSLWLYLRKGFYISVYSAVVAPLFFSMLERVPFMAGHVPKDEMIT